MDRLALWDLIMLPFADETVSGVYSIMYTAHLQRCQFKFWVDDMSDRYLVLRLPEVSFGSTVLRWFCSERMGDHG
jgi:hypothetical protein